MIKTKLHLLQAKKKIAKNNYFKFVNLDMRSFYNFQNT